MKKLVSLILTIVMLFSLSACGKEQSNESVSQKKDSKNADGEYFEFYDAELVPKGNGKYTLDFKIKCNLPEEIKLPGTNNIEFKYNYLDEEGIVVDKGLFVIHNVQAGEIVKASAFDNNQLYDIKFSPSEVAAVEYTGVNIFAEEYIQVDFEKRIRFDISELMVSDDAKSEPSLIEIEGAVLSGKNVTLKARNISGIKRDVITVYVQAIDSGGDILDTAEVMLRDLDDGMASTGVNSSNRGFTCNTSNIAALRISDYKFNTYNEGSKSTWNTLTDEAHSLSEAYVFLPDGAQVKRDSLDVIYDIFNTHCFKTIDHVIFGDDEKIVVASWGQELSTLARKAIEDKKSDFYYEWVDLSDILAENCSKMHNLLRVLGMNDREVIFMIIDRGNGEMADAIMDSMQLPKNMQYTLKEELGLEDWGTLMMVMDQELVIDVVNGISAVDNKN